MDVLKIMLQRREWYREYLKQQTIAPAVLSRWVLGHKPAEVIVRDMRQTLGLEAHPTRSSWEEYYRTLVEKIEQADVLVMRSASLGHHSRTFSMEEFRGFAIADKYARISFVNHADTPGARLFNLIHELCHICIGLSGISDGGVSTHLQQETLCHQVAAELLVPAAEFMSLWRTDVTDWQKNLFPLENHFHVSRWMLFRRALTLNMMDKVARDGFIATLQAAYAAPKKESGGRTITAPKSSVQPCFLPALSGQLLLREASDLLDGIKPA